MDAHKDLNIQTESSLKDIYFSNTSLLLVLLPGLNSNYFPCKLQENLRSWVVHCVELLLVSLWFIE